MGCAIFLTSVVVELGHEAHVIDRRKPRTSLLELAFFKSSNPNFLSRFGTPFLLFLFFIPLRDLIVVGEGETAPVGAAIGLLAETEAEIEEPQSKAASKSSSASPVVVPSPPPPTASSPAPAIAQHAPVATVSDGPRKTVATPYAKKLAKKHKVDIRSVAGIGPFGRITASDVEAAAGIAPSVAAPPPPRPPAAAAKATTTSSSSPPLLPGSSVVPFTAMQSDVSKNMIESLSVPMFRVGYPVNTDALDAPYEKVKPKGVTMTALLAKMQGWLLLSILWPGEELFELPKQHKSIVFTTPKRSCIPECIGSMFSLMEAQRWSTTATGHQQGNNPLVPNKIYSLQPIHVMAGQEISGKLHLVVHRKSVGPGADQGGILHTSLCKLNLKEPYYRMSQPSCTRTTSTTAKVKLASTLDHIGNVAQISPLIGFVHKHVVIVDTEPELEKSEFSVMSLEKCVKQLEEERAT
ncbi:hypothetical protein Bca52824_074565 [Brassica carinata]|uniref:Peripheral subunit-binding (PSBD) domain-containing protein n=1 Tax=Brassica carinata TaxID=52824 RepID=A0A8X7TVP0_BRACI|nr:hypothetical protein Bca52824_074565 [Brassica carinata]